MPYMDVFLVSRVPVNVPDGDTFLPEIVGFNDPIEIKLEKFTVESYFRKLI